MILANLELEIKDSSELERTVNDINQSNQSHGYKLKIQTNFSSSTKVRDAKTCKFIYSKGCKTPLMICYFYSLTYLIFLLFYQNNHLIS